MDADSFRLDLCQRKQGLHKVKNPRQPKNCRGYLLNGKTDLQMIPGNGMRFNTQWSDNYAIVKGDILYINFLIENTNGSYYKENTPHTLCKIKKPKSVKIGNRLSLAGYALSSSGSARANSGQVSLYTGVQDRDDMEIVFLTTDSSTYKMNVTGAILLR